MSFFLRKESIIIRLLIKLIIHRYNIIYQKCVTGLDKIYPIGKLPAHVQGCVCIPMVIFRDDAKNLGFAFDILPPIVFLILGTTSEEPSGVAGAITLVAEAIFELF